MISKADFITLENIFLGTFALLFSITNISLSLILIVIIICLDGFDGFISRKCVSSKYGKFLDTASDTIGFCLVPAVIVYYAMINTFYILHIHYCALLLCIFMCLCGFVRLIRFTVHNQNELSYFIGLPTPACAFSVIVFYVIAKHLLPIIVPIISLLMISKIKYPKINKLFCVFVIISMIFTLFGILIANFYAYVALIFLMIYYFSAITVRLSKR